MVQISEFDRAERTVVFETKEGKIRLSFEEWRQIVEAYRDWV